MPGGSAKRFSRKLRSNAGQRVSFFKPDLREIIQHTLTSTIQIEWKWKQNWRFCLLDGQGWVYMSGSQSGVWGNSRGLWSSAAGFTTHYYWGHIFISTFLFHFIYFFYFNSKTPSQDLNSAKLSCLTQSSGITKASQTSMSNLFSIINIRITIQNAFLTQNKKCTIFLYNPHFDCSELNQYPDSSRKTTTTTV